jgi:hypothetical protein
MMELSPAEFPYGTNRMTILDDSSQWKYNEIPWALSKQQQQEWMSSSREQRPHTSNNSATTTTNICTTIEDLLSRKWALSKKLVDSIVDECDQHDLEQRVDGISWRAWKLVKDLFETCHNLQRSQEAPPSLEIERFAWDEDTMVSFVQRLVQTQEIFRKAGKPTHMDVGYHFTKTQYLPSIRVHGLLTKAERQARNIDSRHNGAAFGDGICTGNNCFTFANYGDTGLSVARLRGETQTATHQGQGFVVGGTALANPNRIDEMVILQHSNQCVPLLKF